MFKLLSRPMLASLSRGEPLSEAFQAGTPSPGRRHLTSCRPPGGPACGTAPYRRIMEQGGAGERPSRAE
ncbi:hypothetical protein HBB16_10030 [Pseudonocardia sp. MCCB 268]|nr:hypothetical protein [Pseudonocardia cytotoxica]